MMLTCKSSMETILTVSTVYSSFLPFTLYFYYFVIESPLVNALYCVYAPHYFRFINKAMSQRCLFTHSFLLSSFTTIFVSFFCFLFSTSLLVRSLVRESCQPLSLNGSQVGVKPMNLLQQVRFINFIKRKGIKTQNTNRALIKLS